MAEFNNYNFHLLERNAQAYWEEHKTFKVEVDHSKEKFYNLVMFPYPSGALHIGHVRNYTIGDVIARYQRMLGKNVLNPFGWDAFGMPAENAAIANKTSPAPWTYDNIAQMTKAVKGLGFSYDWDREVTTCKPDYYKWEQKFFIDLYNKGIAYRKNSAVNWCTSCKTVLANEQVEDGCCWRCDTKVIQKEIEQWFLRISDYAQELIDDLEKIPEWPEKVRQMQRNWIGRSEGVQLTFDLGAEGIAKYNLEADLQKLTVFTTRPDTFMGVTFTAIAANHPLALALTAQDDQVKAFVDQCRAVKTSEADLSTMEKLAYKLDLTVVHPFTGEQVPVYIANYVLMTYGTGAVMAVPGHDERDYEVATKYGIPVKQVIAPVDASVEVDLSKAPYTEHGVLVNSGEFDGMDYAKAYRAIGNKLVEQGRGEYKVNFRLRDWGVSRQRYWGVPIPMIKLQDGTIVPVPDEELPVVLPEDVSLNGVENPLRTNIEWQTTSYQGQPAVRECDTFDTFMESSWYYARYCSPNCDTGMVTKEEADYWLPVDYYVGGIEHAILHLLYSRFFHKLLRNAGYVSGDEPMKKYVALGMVLNNAFYYLNDEGQKVWLNQKNVDLEYDSKGNICGGKTKDGKYQVHYTGMVKMSKSKNNGVTPSEMVENYGADALRLYLMFAAPLEATLEWSESGLEGAFRFIRRYWNLTQDFLKAAQELNVTDFTVDPAQLTKEAKEVRRALHNTIAKVNDDLARRQAFNTAVAAVMELMNILTKAPLACQQDLAIMREALRAVTLMLYPFTPHVGFEVWRLLGEKSEIDFEPVPVADPQAMVAENKTIVVQINGKLRARLEVGVENTEEQIKELAFADDNVIRFTEGKNIVKVIYVKDKLLNVVVK